MNLLIIINSMNSPKIKIVLVDDYMIVRSGLKAIIETQDNMEVIGEAGDGANAITMLTRLQPDIVIMDISMPGLDGISATLEIKGLYPHIKVLVITMHDDEKLLFDVIKAGGSGYLLKNTAFEDLINAINTVYSGENFVTYNVANMLMKDYTHRIKTDSQSFAKYDSLTAREKEVFELITDGLSNRDIADRLYISVRTVEVHRSNIIQKLQLRNTVELINYANRKSMFASK